MEVEGWLVLGIVFVFGLVYGSFLNVVVYRYDDWLSILSTRSHCRECKTNLGPLDLVPVFSYMFLGGKCRYCKKPIALQYPLVEVGTAILMTLGYNLIFNQMEMSLLMGSLAFAFFIIAIGAMVAMMCHDLAEMMIPDSLSNILLVSAALFMVTAGMAKVGFYGALIGFVPIALLVYPSRGKWMGEGDVKLATSLGLLAGFPGAILYMALSFILGGFVGSILLITKKAKPKSAVPFGPFLIVGALVTIFFGATIIEWYMNLIGYYYY